MTRPHEKLDAWRQAMQLVRSFHTLTQAFDLGYLDAQHEVFQLLERAARLVTGFHRKAVGTTTK